MNRLLLFTVVVGAVVAMSVLPGSDVNHVQYIRNFGYISKDSSLVQSDNDMSKAISEFQSMAGIEQTGSMNSETRAMMRMPRCGVHDQTVHMTTLQRRVRRHTRLGSIIWGNLSLTYKISNYTHRISHSDVDKVAKQAFAYWSGVTPLKFRQVRGNESADIHIKFATGDHGDGFPFHGKHGAMLHAYAPRSGIVHINDAEHWVVGESNNEGINLKQVMTHGFGHVLGMGHSKKYAAVMSPFYKGFEPEFKLDIDDIEGIQSMYGINIQR